MLKVALTGGIATGKSHVLQVFKRHGVPCLDADVLARGVTAPGSEAAQAIAERFGPDVIRADGELDRARLGAIVFEDTSARRDLERIVHPGVYRAIAAGLRAFELVDQPRLAVVDIPLLFETGRAADFDKVIVTVCPPATQRQRLVARGLTEVEANQRLAAQLSTGEKASRADFTISTEGTFEDTDAQVEQVLRDLLRDPPA